jgi:Tol biopolymer transport system component
MKKIAYPTSILIMLLIVTLIMSSYVIKEVDEQSDSGYKLAYIAAGNSTRGIVVIDVNGNKDQNFIAPDLPGSYFNGITSAVNGRRIAFMRDVEGIDRYSLWVMNYDGSDLKRLTPKGQEALGPSWAKDGSKLAFTRRNRGLWEIYTINSDGTGLKRISNFREQGSKPQWGPSTSWSPDGKTIAYSISFGSWQDNKVFLMDSDGKNVRKLTDNNYDNRNPDFSPDGKNIAFNTTKNGTRETAILNLTTKELKYLGNNASGFGLAWSPDGKKIAYSGFYDKNRDIFVMDADGSNQVRLSKSPAYDFGPTWIYSK